MDAHEWIGSYRPNAISKFGFSDKEIRAIDHSMILCRVRCYGTSGPWSNKPGFDMQGSASSGLMDLMEECVEDGRPQWPPGRVINDYTTCYGAALAIQSIILENFSGEIDAEYRWLVSPSLTGMAMGILKYLKTSLSSDWKDSEGVEAMPPEVLQGETPYGNLKTFVPLPKMRESLIQYDDGLLHNMSSNKPFFPGFDDGYDKKHLETPPTADLLR